MNLKKPQHVFSVLEDYGLDPNRIPENPHNIYFGRWVSKFLPSVLLLSLKAKCRVGKGISDRALVKADTMSTFVFDFFVICKNWKQLESELLYVLKLLKSM